MGNENRTVGILGATGQVGKELYTLLKERKFPAKEIKLFASLNSEGEESDDGKTILGARSARSLSPSEGVAGQRSRLAYML